MFWTVVVSAAALFIVAVLQYRWTTQVNEATEIRIGTNLQSIMMDWHLDFFREFSAICVALQVGPDSGAHDYWKTYVERYSNWSRVATNADQVENISVDADLVQHIYIWETSRKAEPRLLRLTADNIKIDNPNTSPDLHTLLARLQANSSSIPVALRVWESAGSPIDLSLRGDDKNSAVRSLRRDPMTGWQFDQRIPAIVHPIIHHPMPFDSGAPRSQSAVDWIVVVFDRNTIEKGIFPSLAKRYFGSRQGLEYKVAVTAAGKTTSLLYSSDSDFGERDVGTADATMKIFGPPPESTEGYFWQTVKKGESIRGEEWHNFSAPVWFPVIHYGTDTESWMLAVRHRNDAVDAIVTRLRRRNLAINATVFLLLAVSMSLVVIASHRSKKLVKLQMDFVASVSHELRTPLAVICSAAENIVDGVVEGKQRLTQYGSVIINQGRQLTALVDQILLFSSTREGRTHYVLRTLQVSQILQRALNNTSGLVERAGVTIEQDVQANLPPVLGDLPALSQCLQNLIVNAVKYGGENRWIGICARLNKTKSLGTEIQISVQDCGIGISSTALPHLFKPFYRSPEVKATQIRGTGLGLTLAKSVAEAMGGSLTVISKVGVGSVFTLHLPPTDESDVQIETVMAVPDVSNEP